MEVLLEMARDLARDLQNDERFIRVMMAREAADEDEALQGLIGEFNLKRLALQGEMSKEDPDKEKIEQLNSEAREAYAQLMANEHMAAYQGAKEALDQLVNKMVQILTLAAQGEDPDEVGRTASCGGNCSGCAGCH